MSDTTTQYRFIEISARPRSGTRKTLDYEVRGKGGVLLAVIEFYPAWRQHVLVPESTTVWSSGCLVDVLHFMESIKGGAR